MCNRARQSYGPETLRTNFTTLWGVEQPTDNRSNPVEMTPRSGAYVVCGNDRRHGLDIKSWDVLGGGAAWAMTNIRIVGFTMVTCDPNELVAPVHPKAMITIPHPDNHDRWLRGSYEDVVAL